jgi:hypothetical protein
VERLLASPHVRNSKRCQALLQHIVASALDGSIDGLKERALGCDVFHREPNYDTNQDSIVRTTAAEIRKRLAMYYLEPGRDGEVRISLPSGSYVPEFQFPKPVAAPTAIVELPVAVHAAGLRGWRWRWWAAAAMVLATAGGVLLAATRPTALDRFWGPLIQDGGEITLCIGQPTRVYWFDGPRTNALNEIMVGSDSAPPMAADARQNLSAQLSELKPEGDRYFAFGDVVASMRLGELLARKKRPFRVLGERMALYRDLRGRPLVLIGLSNNRWTLGLMDHLPYYFDRHRPAENYEIRDRNMSGRAFVSVAQGEGSRDEYAIVSRVFDPRMERTVVAVAGLSDRSTGAAGEFLTNERYMQAAFANAPAGWYKKNMQVVIQMALVGGTAGPPKVIRSQFW